MEYLKKELIDDLRNAIHGIQSVFAEVNQVGGSYVTPSNRVMLLALAQMLEAKDILETGYNTGLTTMALALSGANVTGVENHYEDPRVGAVAEARLSHFPNVSLVNEDALLFLVRTPAESYDLIFVDDCHWPEYTKYECIEIQRILRPGGCAVFHDTFYAEIWEVLDVVFPPAWHRINLPSKQVWPGYSGTETMAGRDLGLGVVRKPWHHVPSDKSVATCLEAEQGSDGRPKPSMEITMEKPGGERLTYRGEDTEVMIGIYCQLLRHGVPTVGFTLETQETMERAIRTWGQYSSAMASFVGQERYGHVKAKEA